MALRRLRALLVSGSLLLTLAACGPAPAPDDYFPLDTGLRWDYVVHEHNRVTDSTRRLGMRNLGPAEREGTVVARARWRGRWRSRPG